MFASFSQYNIYEVRMLQANKIAYMQACFFAFLCIVSIMKFLTSFSYYHLTELLESFNEKLLSFSWSYSS